MSPLRCYNVSVFYLLVASVITVVIDEMPASKSDSNSDSTTQTRPDAAQALRNKIQAVTDISKAVAQSAHVSAHM
jgi:hypothetical protein